MRVKPLNAYWASELALDEISPENRPSVETLKAVNTAVATAAVAAAPFAATISAEKALELEQHRLNRTPDRAVVYPFVAQNLQTAAILAEMDYFLTASGIR